MSLIIWMEGKIDLYNGQYNKSIQVWDSIWDECRFMGYNPQTANGIRKYINEQL